MSRFLLTLTFTYLLLTVFGTHLRGLPDLLIIMIIFTGPNTKWHYVGYGLLTGLLLDLTTGLGLYHTLSYTLAGLVLWIMPSAMLQTKLAAGIFNTVLGTLTIHLSYALVSKIIQHQFLLMPWYLLILQIIYNCVVVWALLSFIEWNRGKPDEIL